MMLEPKYKNYLTKKMPTTSDLTDPVSTEVSHSGTDKEEKPVDVSSMIFDNELDFSRNNMLLMSNKEYNTIYKKVNEQSKQFDGNVNVMDAVSNPMQQLGLGTSDPSFTTMLMANRSQSWNLANLDKSMRDIPYFINASNWKSTLALRNGIDINSTDKKLDATRINNIQNNVVNYNQPLYKLIYEGEIYGFCGGLLIIDGQDSHEELEKPINYKIKQGQFLGIKLLTRLYNIVPDTSELFDIDDIKGQKYWANADLIGKPKYYRINLDGNGKLDGKETYSFRVHASRVLTYITNPLSYVESKVELNMGVSMLERVYSEMSRFETLMGQTVRMAQRANIPVLKTDDTQMTMTTLNSDIGLSQLLVGMQLFKKALTNANVVSIGQDDSFDFANATFTDVPAVIEKLENHLAEALGAPVSATFGRKIDKDEEKVKEYIIKKIQDFNLRDWYNRLIPLIYTNIYGEEIPDFNFLFKSIFAETELEKSEKLANVGKFIGEMYDRNGMDVESMINMIKVAQTNVSDVSQEITQKYIEYSKGNKIVDSSIKNKINIDIELGKITNQGIHNPASDKGGDLGGNQKTKKKPTSTIVPEKK